jgi:TetR/AcrR family transcriptional regulator
MLIDADTESARRLARAGSSKAGAAAMERILDAALALFARYGLRGTRIEQIAAEAELSKTNLLYYVGSKDALYRAVLARTLTMWLEPLRELDAALDPEAALSGYIIRKLEASRDHPDASRLWAMEIMQGAQHVSAILETELADLVTRTIAVLERWMNQGALVRMEPRHLLFMIWATTQHYADFAVQIRTLTGSGLEDEAFFAQTCEAVTGTILRGVLVRNSSQPSS